MRSQTKSILADDELSSELARRLPVLRDREMPAMAIVVPPGEFTTEGETARRRRRTRRRAAALELPSLPVADLRAAVGDAALEAIGPIPYRHTQHRSGKVEVALMSLAIERRLALIALAVAALAVLAPLGPSELVYAGHSAEAPYTYWDTNLDGFPDPNQTFYADSDFGGNWTSIQVFRFADAATEWRSDTSYNPTGTIATSTCITRCAYLSSTSQCPLPAGYRAATCKQSTYYAANYFPGAPAHYRLTRTLINFNTSGFKFHYGTGAPPDSSYSDFQGVATHEFGHTVWLVDLGTNEGCDYSSNYLWTMCTGGSNSTTYRRRSVESDDVNAANEVY